MNIHYKKFIKESALVSGNLKHRKTILFNISKYDAAVQKGKLRYIDTDTAKINIAARKRKALNHLDEMLIEFETKISARGVSVYWAKNREQACDYVSDVIKEYQVSGIVKSKSMTTEEIGFNEFVEKMNVNSIETDLGEYIVQLAGEKPYHIVTPAMHKSKSDVNNLFNEKFGINLDLSAQELTNFVRVKLRSEYSKADIGVTGANFLIADIGGVAVTENEGNALMSTSFPKIHIVIAGLEKIVPSVKDLGFFWPVLASHGTGQSITVYNSIFTGPVKGNEDSGPGEMFVILLDNKRSELLNNRSLNDALACIRCGACLNACPVYRNIGGYTYNSTYTGPIGSIISPFYESFKDKGHLSFACTICGKCTEVCPAKIDLHLLMLRNRNLVVKSKPYFSSFSAVIRFYKFFSLQSKFFDMGLNSIKNFLIHTLGKNLFGKKRYFPKFKKSFRSNYFK